MSPAAPIPRHQPGTSCRPRELKVVSYRTCFVRMKSYAEEMGIP